MWPGKWSLGVFVNKNDQEIYSLELKIARFLRSGILIAAGFIALGWLSQISFTENPFVKFQTYQQIRFVDMAEVSFMIDDWSFFVSYTGLFILISLPVIRVLLTGILFLRQKEKAMATMAFVVLFFLVLSFVLGF